MGLDLPYVPVSERGEFAVEYIIGSLDNKAIKCHPLTADTSAMAKTCVGHRRVLGGRGALTDPRLTRKERKASLINSPI